MRYFEMRKARIEIIPMIDIMLFLLVFFIMVTLRMIPASGISSQLPQSSTAQDLPHPKVVVTLLADGEIEVDDQKMTLDALTTKLESEPDPSKTDVTIAVEVPNIMASVNPCSARRAISMFSEVASAQRRETIV